MVEYITKRGLRILRKELKELRDVKRWEIAKWLREAASGGDLSENAEYMEAKEVQTALEVKIEIIEEKLRSAKVVSGHKRDIVEVGSAIVLASASARDGRDGSASKKTKLKLVGSEEADVSAGFLSAESPMGKAVLGKRVGETVKVSTPRGIRKYKLTKIA